MAPAVGWVEERPQNLLWVLSHRTVLMISIRKLHTTASTQRATACDDTWGQAPSPGACTNACGCLWAGAAGSWDLATVARAKPLFKKRSGCGKMAQGRQTCRISSEKPGSQPAGWGVGQAFGKMLRRRARRPCKAFPLTHWASFPSNQPPPWENPVLNLPPATARSFSAKLLRSLHALRARCTHGRRNKAKGLPSPSPRLQPGAQSCPHWPGSPLSSQVCLAPSLSHALCLGKKNKIIIKKKKKSAMECSQDSRKGRAASVAACAWRALPWVRAPWGGVGPLPLPGASPLPSRSFTFISLVWQSPFAFSFKVLYIQELLQSTARKRGQGYTPAPRVLLSLII